MLSSAGLVLTCWPVDIFDWAGSAKESWRAGSESRLHASARTGATRLCVGEQWFDPGVGTPVARHAAGVEEVISVLSGAAEVTIEGETRGVRAGQSVIVPPGAAHQLVAVGDGSLHIWFVLSESAPATYLIDDGGAVFTIGGVGQEQLADTPTD